MIEYLAPIYLATTSRMAGDKYLKWPGVALYPVPYCVIGYAAYNSWVIPVLIYAWVFGWKITGHQDGFAGAGRDNTLSPMVIKIANALGYARDSKQYDALFWAIKGGMIASVPAAIIAVFTASYASALAIFCASFCAYPLAYYLGFHVLNRKLGMVNTAWGEMLSGFFAGLGFVVAYIIG